MELTSIKISEETKKKLNLLKYKLGYKSIDELINKLIQIVPINQLKKGGKIK